MRSMIPCGIALVEIGDLLVGLDVERRRNDSQWRGALHQLAERLPHGRKILIEVRRHFGQIIAVLGFLGQTEADANLINLLQGQRDLRVPHAIGFLVLVEILFTDGSRVRLVDLLSAVYNRPRLGPAWLWRFPKRRH